MNPAGGQNIPKPYSLTIGTQTMGLDPASGMAKKLTISYATSSGEYQAVVPDGSTLYIPSAGHTLVGPGQVVSGFVVLSAAVNLRFSSSHSTPRGLCRGLR